MGLARPVPGITKGCTNRSHRIWRVGFGGISLQEAPPGLRAWLRWFCSLVPMLDLLGHGPPEGLLIGGKALTSFFRCAHGLFELGTACCGMSASCLGVAILLDVLTLRAVLVEAVLD